MSKITPNSECIQYADDSTLYPSGLSTKRFLFKILKLTSMIINLFQHKFKIIYLKVLPKVIPFMTYYTVQQLKSKKSY